MADENNDRFVRWQQITRQQVSGAINLILGLATGLVAFQARLLLDNKLGGACSKRLGIAAMTILGLSILFGIWCTLNRLADFRLTTRVTKLGDKPAEDAKALRGKARARGKKTWALFGAQLGVFAIGTVVTIVSVLAELLGGP